MVRCQNYVVSSSATPIPILTANSSVSFALIRCSMQHFHSRNVCTDGTSKNASSLASRYCEACVPRVIYLTILGPPAPLSSFMSAKHTSTGSNFIDSWKKEREPNPSTDNPSNGARRSQVKPRGSWSRSGQPKSIISGVFTVNETRFRAITRSRIKNPGP